MSDNAQASGSALHEHSSDEEGFANEDSSPHIYAIVMTILQEMRGSVITDKDIITELNNFSAIYDYTKPTSIGTVRTDKINYHKPSYHCAYMYRYFTAIAHTTKSYWNNYYEQLSQGLEKIFFTTSTTKHFVCVGGGPATDLIGFYLFLKENDLNMKLRATILDFDDWSSEHEKIIKGFDAESTIIGYRYVNYNFFDDLTMGSVAYQALNNADIVSVVKFLSAVGHSEQWKSANKNGVYRLRSLMKILKQGAIVFSMENSGGGYSETFKRAAKEEKFKLLHEIKSSNTKVDIPTNLIHKYQIADQQPTKSLNVAATIWKKS